MILIVPWSVEAHSSVEHPVRWDYVPLETSLLAWCRPRPLHAGKQRPRVERLRAWHHWFVQQLLNIKITNSESMGRATEPV
eukprot:131715-Pyramimonas_sp.AAC.1